MFALGCVLSGSKVQKDCMEDDEEEQIGRFYLYSSGKQTLLGKYSTRCCMFRINAKYVATTNEAIQEVRVHVIPVQTGWYRFPVQLA